MAKTETIKTASVLAFERKLDPSDALFYAGRWDDRDQSHSWAGVGVAAKSVRGTISNRLKAKDQQDSAKLDASIQAPNLQTVDVAALPSGADTLKARFTLRILSGAGAPSACNNADYQAKLLATVDGYRRETGFGELARRYAANLANGRFLWRNRVGAEQVEVRIDRLVRGAAVESWTFDGLGFSLRGFDAAAPGLDGLAKAIEHRLIPPRHPQTNGMVERFNGRIADVLRTTRFESTADLATTLRRYADIYNHAIPQRALGHVAPINALAEWRERKPELFVSAVDNLTGLDR